MIFADTSALLAFLDRVSFELMRARGIDAVLAPDQHFAGEGFRLVLQ